MPNTDSAQLMTIVDSFEPGWRALVHEYGFKAVCQAKEDGHSLEDAGDALWMARSARQATWLSTNYITKKSWGDNATAN
ncbi:MAG TPA: hypothetical protein VK602_13760 [Phyllobacterium sp.]|nr:hypothetical protein [Phyllobacterium sp.]